MEFADPKREIGDLKKEEKKRPGRKAKKHTEKEIMHEYNLDQDKPAAQNLVIKQQRKIYENFQYLSAGERELFDQKFTKPKTNSQEIYASMLKAKNKKIILATGDINQLESIESVSDVKNYDEYMNQCITMICPKKCI